MTHETPKNGLHLPTLAIAGFRGIQELAIGRLGRVTLLTGNNGVGKTTVLEAVRVFAARGRQSTLSSLLRDRDEYAAEADDDDDKIRALDFAALFFGRSPSRKRISIGPVAIAHQLTIEEVALTEEQLSLVEGLIPELPSDGTIRSLLSRFEGTKQILPFFSMDAGSSADGRYTRAQAHAARVLGRAMGAEKSPPEIRCRSLGPGVLEDDKIAKWWNDVALTPDEDKVVDALRLVVNGVERAAVVTGHTGHRRRRNRVIVRFKGDPAPVPLKSLGDGAVRLFGVALALANSRHGFLVIDEAENGIHHSLQERFWRMVLQTAEANNVQVLATTHSRDCTKGFARAAAGYEPIDGALARINRQNGEVWAVEYPEKDMLIAAEQGIEVR
ncbi:AAA family ATPase [Candidatus Palauibacter sp.]|uniref:AAA family ATPase n=1 Tax=Candidatus Palauibacter sp. TaxID=3101350 RepID=UPI003B01553E